MTWFNLFFVIFSGYFGFRVHEIWRFLYPPQIGMRGAPACRFAVARAVSESLILTICFIVLLRAQGG